MQLLQPGQHGCAGESATSFERVLTLEKQQSYTLSKIARGLIGPIPISILNYFSTHAARELATILKAGQFDTVQLESIHLLEYIKVIRAAPNRPAILMDWHNIESELMRRYAANAPHWPKRAVARRTAKLLEKAEERAISEADVHTVVSERDKRAIISRLPQANVRVVPNGVDVDFYSVSLNVPAAVSRQTLLFVGSMDYHANIDAVTWFVGEVWPTLSRIHPALEFVIAGSNPAPSVQALQSARVRVTGTVADVRPFYERALAVVVPLRAGGGTRLKILEAMAARVPVISTRLGAEGLPVRDGLHLLLADSADEIVQAVTYLIHNPGDRGRLITSAAAFVTRCYDWSAIGEALYAIHSELAGAIGASSFRPPSRNR